MEIDDEWGVVVGESADERTNGLLPNPANQ